MSLKISMVTAKEARPQPNVIVFGVGGGGGNAVANMVHMKLQGARFIAANTDLQVLEGHPADIKIKLGSAITQGLGAGANPEVGAAAAEESYQEIMEAIKGADMIFVTAGMGGGTGTGAAPVVARAAKELGILTVAVVTKPFSFEGTRRMRMAESGIEELQQHADTVITIHNQNLFRLANERTSLQDAFRMADEVLYKSVQGITDLFRLKSLVNLDFNDVKTVMSETGQAMMGTGEAEGDRRAILAAEMAISSPLLDGLSLNGARGLLVNVIGSDDMTLFEAEEAANRIREEVDPEANIIFGAAIVPEMKGKIRVSVVATGIGQGPLKKRPSDTSHYTSGAFGFGAASRRNEGNNGPKAQATATTSNTAKETTKDGLKDDSRLETLFTPAMKEDKPISPKATKKPAIDDDLPEDLEIPAFLRRQVN